MSKILPKQTKFIMPDGIKLTVSFELGKTVYKGYHKLAKKVIYIY